MSFSSLKKEKFPVSFLVSIVLVKKKNNELSDASG